MKFRTIGYDYFADETIRDYYKSEDGKIYVIETNPKGMQKVYYLRDDLPDTDGKYVENKFLEKNIVGNLLS